MYGSWGALDTPRKGFSGKPNVTKAIVSAIAPLAKYQTIMRKGVKVRERKQSVRSAEAFDALDCKMGFALDMLALSANESVSNGNTDLRKC